MITKLKSKVAIFVLSVMMIIACNVRQVDSSQNLQISNETVGSTYFIWEDIEREDPYYGGNRIVNVQMWYPIDKLIDKSSYKEAPYYFGSDSIWSKLEDWSENDIELVSNILTYALIDAPIRKGVKKYPLIIFSPSLGGNLSLYNFYAELLASNGYVVMGVNHLYESEFVVSNENKIFASNLAFHDSLKTLSIPDEISADEYRLKKGIRSKVLGEDLIFSLNKLMSIDNSVLRNQIDFDKIGVWGHSFGGAAAIQASLMDKRIDAIINIDGTPPTLNASQQLDVPYMYIEDLTDYKLHDGLMKQYVRRDLFCQKINNKAYRILIGETHHGSFTAINYHFTSDMQEKSNFLKVLKKTSFYMLDFFNHALLDYKLKLREIKSDSLEVKFF